jgi:hypothetical protein
MERLLPSVYRLAGARETWMQQVMAAVLDSGGWASHRTAAALHDLDGHSGGVIEVVVQRWRRSSQHPGYRVHETKDLQGVDLTHRYGIPCTSLVRTLIDLPAVESRYRAEQALDDGCRKRDWMLGALRLRFCELATRGRRGTRTMRAMLDERPGGHIPPGSSFEARTLRMLADQPVPKPERQIEVRDGEFVAYIDIGWSTIRFGIECDSLAHHFGRRAHQWDRTRRRRLKRLGWDLVEVTYEDVIQRPAATAAELLALYRQRAATFTAPVLASTAAHIGPWLTPESVTTRAPRRHSAASASDSASAG